MLSMAATQSVSARQKSLRWMGAEPMNSHHLHQKPVGTIDAAEE